MPESIDMKLKRVAVMLADELNYLKAAEKLNLTTAVLRSQISALETQLCLHLFKPRQKKVELTEDGEFLIKAFREAVALHDKTDRDEPICPDS